MMGEIAGLWGLFGGFAVEGLELYAAWQRYRRWPWQAHAHSRTYAVEDAADVSVEAGLLGYVVAETVRLLIGAGLAWAAAATGQISGPLGALGVGAAAPTIIGQLARDIPLQIAPPAAAGPSRRVSGERPAASHDHQIADHASFTGTPEGDG